MLGTLSLVAVLAAALFAGAALYINVAEQPARLTLDTRSAAEQWAPSYRRATWMQAPLALVSLLCGIAVWLMSGNIRWLIAAILIGLVVPFTLIGIMPTNKSLLLSERDWVRPRLWLCSGAGEGFMRYEPRLASLQRFYIFVS